MTFSPVSGALPHIAGIRKTVEDDKYCVDILRQTYVVRKSREKLEGLSWRSSVAFEQYRAAVIEKIEHYEYRENQTRACVEDRAPLTDEKGNKARKEHSF